MKKSGGEFSEKCPKGVKNHRLVFLQNLSLTGFKNYASAKLEFSPHWNFFSGRNGSGKTNLLDAIHYLCLGKSYFHSSDLNSVKHGENFFRLDAHFTNDEKYHVVCVYQAGAKKELKKNDVIYSRIANHVGLIPVVMITPDDQLLIDEGSEERRRFIDGTISQIDHSYLELLIEYNRVLGQRNAALKRFAERNVIDRELLDSYDAQLSASGHKIFEARKKYLDLMIPMIEHFYGTLSGAAEKVGARYESVCQHETILNALKKSFQKDSVTQRTNEGIHRDDFDFLLNGRSMKKFGSQGQKKSFLMALKFAQYDLIRKEKNQSPLLLLDDLFDKLDEERSANVFRLISENGFGQVFITDTHEERVMHLFKESRRAIVHYRVSGGQAVDATSKEATQNK